MRVCTTHEVPIVVVSRWRSGFVQAFKPCRNLQSRCVRLERVTLFPACQKFKAGFCVISNVLSTLNAVCIVGNGNVFHELPFMWSV